MVFGGLLHVLCGRPRTKHLVNALHNAHVSVLRTVCNFHYHDYRLIILSRITLIFSTKLSEQNKQQIYGDDAALL